MKNKQKTTWTCKHIISRPFSSIDMYNRFREYRYSISLAAGSLTQSPSVFVWSIWFSISEMRKKSFQCVHIWFPIEKCLSKLVDWFRVWSDSEFQWNFRIYTQRMSFCWDRFDDSLNFVYASLFNVFFFIYSSIQLSRSFESSTHLHHSSCCSSRYASATNTRRLVFLCVSIFFRRQNEKDS